MSPQRKWRDIHESRRRTRDTSSSPGPLARARLRPQFRAGHERDRDRARGRSARWRPRRAHAQSSSSRQQPASTANWPTCRASSGRRNATACGLRHRVGERLRSRAARRVGGGARPPPRARRGPRSAPGRRRASGGCQASSVACTPGPPCRRRHQRLPRRASGASPRGRASSRSARLIMPWSGGRRGTRI